MCARSRTRIPDYFSTSTQHWNNDKGHRNEFIIFWQRSDGYPDQFGSRNSNSKSLIDRQLWTAGIDSTKTKYNSNVPRTTKRNDNYYFSICYLYYRTMSWRFRHQRQFIVLHQIIRSWYTGRWWVGCYIWYSEEGPGRAAWSPLRCIKMNSPPINGQCTNHCIVI